jgi:hypothetical protein
MVSDNPINSPRDKHKQSLFLERDHLKFLKPLPAVLLFTLLLLRQFGLWRDKRDLLPKLSLIDFFQNV